ncbi:hypothetical protein EA796_12570 [Pseudomonas sp. AOB-7]|jgi:hypothetical protein|uniref:hypothetical protein n=1 Tax=Pseudomonas sp. AOB-7 TaxID=2482750 RepID=UPI000EFC31D9|nr:hypothetical protein [Pseudomonas sp. AOB-7]RMH84520.1 hypothetical protein EA796_12570 [Pseudomonas sp. AOB-7]
MALNPNINDEGAPTGGRGLEDISIEPRLFQEAQGLIDSIDDTSKIFRNRTKNSQYESDKLHVDAVPIGNRTYPYKIEVQRKKGSKNTVAVCIAAASASAGDVRAALHASLGDHHIWSAQ